MCKHDDILDPKARILDEDLGVVWPKELPKDVKPAWMKKLGGGRRKGSMASQNARPSKRA